MCIRDRPAGGAPNGATSGTLPGAPAAPIAIGGSNASERIAILANSRSGVHTCATGMARAADGGDANVAAGVAEQGFVAGGVPAGLANESSGSSAEDRRLGLVGSAFVFSAALAAALALRVEVRTAPSATRDAREVVDSKKSD